MNWEIVSVNPNNKIWNWKDLFCFWGSSIQSLIGFSLIASLFLVYQLNFFVVMIIVPIILPLIEALGFNLTWFAILVAVNLQTAWLSPPVALSAYFLKGVVPEWDLKDIYLGMMQFMVLQVIGLVIIILFPKIVLWLPTVLYGQ